jgi:hypothetical protein
MNTLMGILRFAGKASLQVLKTAVSFAAGTVAALWALYGLVVLRISRTPSLFGGKFAKRSPMVAVFAGVFYLTFKLLEPRMAARKKLLVATLGIVLLPASVFALFSTPILDITEFFQRANPPGPPKPYEEAIYDVYSGLLNEEMTHRPLLNKLIDPIPEGLLIRIDTTIETGTAVIGVYDLLNKGWSGSGPEASAWADFVRRNKGSGSFELQRKFNLPKYDLITKAEEEAVLKDQGTESLGCREFVRKHPDYYRWVELSAVGFNEDQTVAYLYMVEWRGSRQLCLGIFGHGGPRILRKRNGKWYLTETGGADWVT